MQFSLTTDDPAEAAQILEMLNDSGRSRPARSAGYQGNNWDDSPPPDDAPDDVPDDPWAEPDERPRQRQQSQQGQGGGGSKVPRSGTHEVDTPKGVRFWTFGLENAPVCECGMPAARQTPTNNPPYDWARWTCPLAFSKDTYKGKCSFNQWA